MAKKITTKKLSEKNRRQVMGSRGSVALIRPRIAKTYVAHPKWYSPNWHAAVSSDIMLRKESVSDDRIVADDARVAYSRIGSWFCGGASG